MAESKKYPMDRYDGAGDGGALYGSSVTSYHIEFYPYSVFLRKRVCRSFKPDAFLEVFLERFLHRRKTRLMSNEAGQERSPCQQQQLTQSIHVSRV